MSRITRRVWGAGCLGLGLRAVSASAAGEPVVTRRNEHDCPQGGACLTRLGLTGKGEIKHELTVSAQCEMPTAFGSGSMQLTLKPLDRPCHELGDELGPESLLAAAIHTQRREDDLAFLCGTFTLASSFGLILFEGSIDLMHRVNTHVQPFGNHQCNAENMLQGWLTGGRPGQAESGFPLLRAMIVARTQPVDSGKSGWRLELAHLNGVVLNRAGP